jgi:signal transduction histidine kinase
MAQSLSAVRKGFSNEKITMTDKDSNRIKPSILYVDDEEPNLLLFRAAFGKHYTVHTARSAEEGIEILKEQPVQVVVTDQNMPGISGVEFLQRTVEEYPEAIRLLLTGNSNSEEIVKAINHGKIYHYINKPWKADEVKIIIDKAFEHYNLKSHNQQLIHSLESRNKQLANAMDELELFLYRSSHDLRGPLATQMGLLKLSMMESGASSVKEYLTKLEECTYNLTNTLDKISKVNVFNIGIIKGYEIDLTQLFKEILDTHQDKINDLNIETRMVSPIDPTFYSNPELIKILFENLLENAINFSDRHKSDPFIHVAIENTNSELKIEFVDNGIGIEEKYVSRIFDPFFKLNTGNGNGLGLYVVEKILKKLGGNINVSSEFKVGTKIMLTLPCLIFEESELRHAS